MGRGRGSSQRIFGCSLQDLDLFIRPSAFLRLSAANFLSAVSFIALVFAATWCAACSWAWTSIHLLSFAILEVSVSSFLLACLALAVSNAELPRKFLLHEKPCLKNSSELQTGSMQRPRTRQWERRTKKGCCNQVHGICSNDEAQRNQSSGRCPSNGVCKIQGREGRCRKQILRRHEHGKMSRMRNRKRPRP